MPIGAVSEADESEPIERLTGDRSNRAALITGGARGIGLGIAKSLAADGYSLALNGVRPEEQVDAVLAQFRDAGTEVVYCQGDVGSADDRASIIRKVRDEFGRLDVLINNAGITSPGRKDLLEAEEESFDRVVAVNLNRVKPLFQLETVSGQYRGKSGLKEAGDGRVTGGVTLREFGSNAGPEIIHVDAGRHMVEYAVAGFPEIPRER